MFPNAAEGTAQVLNERRIRGSVSFQSLHDVYEHFLTMKTDIVHTKIAAGLSHGLAISYSTHTFLNGSKGNSTTYLAPTLVGTGNNSSGQLGSQINAKFQGQESIDGFEKIFLLSSREEYYPIQWLDSIQESFEKNKDKAEFIGMHSDKIKEALSKSKIFFAGKIPTFPDEGTLPSEQNKPELSSAFVKKMTHKESLRPILRTEGNQNAPLFTTRITLQQQKEDEKELMTYANQESNENEPLLYDTEDNFQGDMEEEDDDRNSVQSDDEEKKKKLNRDLLIAQEQVNISNASV